MCVILRCSPRLYSGLIQSWPPGMLALGPSGRGPATGQVQLQPVLYPGPHSKSHQVISKWLPPCVCFYILVSAALSPSPGKVVLCFRCSVGLSGTVFSGTRARCFRYVPLWLLCPPVVVETWLLFACQWEVLQINRDDFL